MAASPIPMSRIGDRAFNHSASNDAEAEYDRLRDLARNEGDKMRSCFDQSHELYSSGDGAGAKHKSEEGKRHQKQRDAYNKQASEYIFRENNAVGRVGDDTIDLHGQFVEEAEDILEARIRDAQARGQTHLHVIVGKGNHSSGHVQKIKPRVEQICQNMGLQYATEENEGRLYINLSGGQVDGLPSLPSQPGGYQGGYASGGSPYPGSPSHSGGGSPYPGSPYQQGGGHKPQAQHHTPQQGYQQQQHHQQQQQQQQQGNEVEQLVEKLLPRIFKKLDGCCIVM
ncbi:hypothetical protein B0T26DRAFT_654595 [Lasiosphaeria miniovina]|uniref:Smr domain-containing protein n=1 Tax=Lasiosphaeria miniovina TaxID=1954250 RepID=A0AA40DPZ5_9PEZI|nr:uncharacterized protein B0T26DRAFT_654595 [Lasiosphaeria miniovina]KAK0709161.1 hypothetical protein B0T26DRAFT_654595 [Lasiosphaeria miniovina]